MKKIFFNILFIAAGSIATAQLLPDKELNAKLVNKIIFSDIKQTVLNHYQQKLNQLSPFDSVAKNEVMKKLKKWNRQFWISENYVDINGRVQDAGKVNIHGFEVMKNLAIPKVNQPESQITSWIPAGPFTSPQGIGRIDKIAFHPTNPNILFAGSPHGGLFKSDNGGNLWLPIGEFLPSLGISGISINPINPNIMYVLTGDANSSNPGFVNQYLYRSNSTGVYKSTDGGANWFATAALDNNPASFQGRELIIDPNNPEVLLAATSKGMYRTANGGNSWTPIPNIIGFNVWDIKFKPGDPQAVYIAGNNWFAKSTNNGISFSPISVSGFSTAIRISIGVTPNNPNRVVLFTGPMMGAGASFNGIFSSNNSGTNFNLLTQTPNLFASYIGTPNTSDQSNYNNCITISPLNENEIYVGGLCVWKSTNGGTNWNQVSAYWPADNPYMHPDIHELRFNPLNSYLYCVNDGGVNLYNGSSWGAIYNQLNTTQFFHFERENDEGDIWGGAQDNGVLEQNGGGNYFYYATGDGYDVMTDHPYLVNNGDADDIYFSVNQYIYKDVIGGVDNITPTGNQEFFANLGMSPDLEDKIFAGYQSQVYLSFDAGDNWVTLGNIPGNWCISTCKSNTDVIYAAGTNGVWPGGIRRWTWANPWTDLTGPLIAAGYNSNLKITDIDVHPANHNIVYISVAGNQSNSKVFRTFNAGASWENLSFNLPNVPIFSIKKDANDNLYIGTSVGVFYKKNGVNYWEPFSNGLPPVPVTEIELWPPTQSTEIWVSTFGRGLWLTNLYNPGCPVDLTLTLPAIGNQLHEASGTINSSQIIYGGAGTNVKYNAGTKITLSNGFKALTGSKFRTYSLPCGSGILSLNLQGGNTPDSSTNENIKPPAEIPIKKED